MSFEERFIDPGVVFEEGEICEIGTWARFLVPLYEGELDLFSKDGGPFLAAVEDGVIVETLRIHDGFSGVESEEQDECEHLEKLRKWIGGRETWVGDLCHVDYYDSDYFTHPERFSSEVEERILFFLQKPDSKACRSGEFDEPLEICSVDYLVDGANKILNELKARGISLTEDSWSEKVARFHLQRAKTIEGKAAKRHLIAAVDAWPEIRKEIFQDENLDRLWELFSE